MNLSKTLTTLSLILCSSPLLHAIVTQVPGPDDTGGMVMPTVLIQGNNLSFSWSSMDMGEGMGMGWNPTTDSVEMGSIGYWTEGDNFAPGTTYGNLLNPASAGGAGMLFSTRYGFWVDGNSSALASGSYLAIRLNTVTLGVEGWNTPSNEVLNKVFSTNGDTVLWSGGMWHTLFTVSPDLPPGLYSAQFEIFVANAPGGVSWDGLIDSTSAWTVNSDYNSVFVPYSFNVVPEPSVISLLFLGLLGVGLLARKRLRTV